MKHIKHLASEAFEYLFAGFFLLLFSPIIIIIFIFIGPFIFYDWLWRTIRKDPNVDLAIPAIENVTVNQDSFTKEGFEKQFSKLTEVIAELSNANLGIIQHEDYEIFERQAADEESKSISLSRTLSTTIAEVKITLHLYASFDKKSNSYFIDLDEGEEWDSPLLPVKVTIQKPTFHINRDFTLYSRESAWLIISLLRGDVEFTHVGNQLWAYVKEKNVWVVEYKLNKGGYGLRKEFKNKVAYKNGVDK